MNQDHSTTDNEIIDVKPLLNIIKAGFNGFLKLILSIVAFYKRNVILFGTLLVLGIVGGYFMGKELKTDKKYKQEIILHPKYEIGNFMYSFVDNLNSNLKDSVFLKKINLDKNLAKNIKGIYLEPIIQAADVLDGLHVKYGDRDFFHHIIEDYDAQKLQDDRYKSFYKYHKLSFYFKTKSEDNGKISKIILDHITKNEYYNNLLLLKLKQTKYNLENNKQTLAFIEEYLAKLNKNSPTGKEKEIIFFTKESDIPTISSLLGRKESLLKMINEQEKTIALDSKLINIVEYNGVISESVPISKRLLILFPMLLFGFVSILFLIKYIFKNINV